jgi:hypothetical protein
VTLSALTGGLRIYSLTGVFASQVVRSGSLAATLAELQQIAYLPAAGWSGVDTVTAVVSSSLGASNLTVTVPITVVPQPTQLSTPALVLTTKTVPVNLTLTASAGGALLLPAATGCVSLAAQSSMLC